MVIKAWSWNSEKLLSCLLASSQYRSTHFFAWPSVAPSRDARIRFPQARYYFWCSCGNSGFENIFVAVDNIFACFAFPLSAPKWTWSRHDVGSPKSTSFMSIIHSGSVFFFFPASCHTVIIRWFFIQYRELCKSCPRIWQFSISINVPMIVNAFLQHYIQWHTFSPGHVNIPSGPKVS